MRLFRLVLAAMLIAGASGQTLEDRLKQLHDPDVQKRYQALGALRAFPPDDTLISALIEARKDESIRLGIARLLGDFAVDPVRGVPALIQLLDDPAPGVRFEAASALGKFRKQASASTPKLEALLGDADNLVRLYAIRALGAVAPDDRGVQSMIAAQLKDPRGDIRSAALETLSDLGQTAKSYLPQFVAALNDPADYVRAIAAQSIGRLGPAAADALPALVAAGRKAANATVYYPAAIVGVAKDRPEAAVPMLIEVLGDEAGSPGSHWMAAKALGDIGAPARGATAALRKAAENGPDFVRKAAAEALAKVGPEPDMSTAEGIATVIAMLTSGDAIWQEHARAALEKAGAAAIPALLELVRTAPDDAVRLAGVRGLRAAIFHGNCVADAVPVLIALVSGGGSAAIQDEAAGALGYCETLSDAAAAPVVEALIPALANPAVRQEALWSLGQFRERAAPSVPALRELLAQALKRDPEETKALPPILDALGQIGTASQSTAPLILPLLERQDFGVTGPATRALAGMHCSDAVPSLARTLQHPLDGVRAAAALAISQIFSDPQSRAHVSDTIPLLLPHLKDSWPQMRAWTALALAQSGSTAAVQPVLAALDDANYFVRMEAATGVIALLKDPGGEWVRQAALPALIRTLDDPVLSVVDHAAMALKLYGPAGAPALPALRRNAPRMGKDRSVADTIQAIEAKQ